MDDIRMTAECVQFKNDINLLFVKSDSFRTYKEQKLMENEKLEIIRVKRRNKCKKHKKEYVDLPELPCVCQHKYEKKEDKSKNDNIDFLIRNKDFCHNIYSKFDTIINDNKNKLVNNENEIIKIHSKNKLENK